jgi:hypothetical protein
MQEWKAGYRCGTVACLGGTAELLGGISFTDEVYGLNDGDDIEELFHPSIEDWDIITEKDGAKALRNYLTTGNANWKEVMGDRA